MPDSLTPLTRRLGLTATPKTAKLTFTTDREVKALKAAPPGKRYIAWDASQRHFGVRVTDGDAKSFIVVRRRPGERDPITHVIGKFDPNAKPKAIGSLAHARAAARAALSEILDGRRPGEAEEKARRADAAKRRDNVRIAVEAFLAGGALDELRSGAGTESHLRREFIGQRRSDDGEGWVDGAKSIWRDRPVREIERRDVIARLDEIKRERGKFAARNALGAIRVFFAWCVEGERFGVATSPCANVNERTIGFTKDRRELKRKRVLNDAELRDVWAAADTLTATARNRARERGATDVTTVFDPVEPLVKLLALTGQRLNDIAKARWSDIDRGGATLRIPPERYKTGSAHEVPLSKLALDLIEALPRFAGYAMTTTGGRRPISGFNKMKRRLDVAIAERGRAAMPAWVLHDLRRTVRTRLVSDLNVDAFIAERVIGHALPGLHGVYDQGLHRPQKRDALDRWADALSVIVGLTPPPGADVVTAAEVDRRRRKRGRA